MSRIVWLAMGTIIYLQCDDLIKADLYNVTFPNFHPQIDLKERVQTALKSPPEGGCRELITILACSNILCKFLNDPNITKVSTEYLSYMIKFACCTLQEEVCLLSDQPLGLSHELIRGIPSTSP